MGKRIIAGIFALVFIFLMTGCGPSVDTNTNGLPDPDKIVPKRDVLIENLENSGYSIATTTKISDSELVVDRVIAHKGNKFIDIVYGLSAEEAREVFELYCGLYQEDDYYILAQNGNYVYCVSDKRTFKKAGFTTLGNVGEQYIHD